MQDYLPYLPLLFEGLKVTLAIFACAATVAAVFAVVAGTARFARPVWLRWPAGVLVEFFRGTSCFVQLFWCFYTLPLFGLTLSPFVASVIVLGLNVGSYGSEVVRGALVAVPKGQIEAARALNYTALRSFLHILLPQSMRIAIRPAANLMVDLLKLTPITSLVTVSELTRDAMVMRSQTGSTISTLLCIFVVYFLLASAIYFVMDRVEAHFFHRKAAPTAEAHVAA